MIKRKIKLRVIAVAITLVGIGGCREARYTCISWQSQYVVCTQGTDTIRYLTPGYADSPIRVRTYYENLGYRCAWDTFFILGNQRQIDNIFNKKEVKYLESQGFYCYEKMY